MDVKFKYEYGGEMTFGKVYRPIARVSFRSPNQDTWTSTWLVVDTGADFSILPKYVSRDLAISLETDCVKDLTSGVGGQQTIYLCKRPITARIGKFTRDVPLGFFNSDEIPGLLGRLGFLETFDTEFLKSHSVVFKD